MRRNLTSTSLATSALVLCVAMPAQAAYTTYAYAGAEVLGRVRVDANDQVQDATVVSQSVPGVGAAATASATNGLHVVAYGADAGTGSSAWAQVAAGGIHLTSSASGSAFSSPAAESSVLGRGIGSASGDLAETLTFSAGALAAGTPVIVTYSVNITGSFDWNGQRNSDLISGYQSRNNMSWNVSLNGYGDGSSSNVWMANGDLLDYNIGSTGIQSIVATVELGRDMSLHMSAAIGASGQAGLACSGNCGLVDIYAEGSAASNFGSTFAWNGIQSLTDLNGNPLDWSVSSSSGFDYRNAYVSAVPELPSVTLLLGGLAWVGWRRRGWR